MKPLYFTAQRCPCLSLLSFFHPPVRTATAFLSLPSSGSSQPPFPKSSPLVAYARRPTKKDFLKAIQEFASKLYPPEESSNVEKIKVETCMEVFDVRIQRFDGKTNSRIYGRVDRDGEDLFYDRPRTNPESVNLASFPLLLTGPMSPATIEFDALLVIHIRDADTDEEVINGSPPDVDPDCYDSFIRHEVRRTHGSAIVSYAVFRKAVSAVIEIKLSKGGANVYSVVTAWNTSMSEGRSVLFHREKEQSVNVVPKELVPLSRDLVALLEDCDLKLLVELWNCHSVIADKTVTFQRKHRTGERAPYRIINGHVIVIVHWTTV